MAYHAAVQACRWLPQLTGLGVYVLRFGTYLNLHIQWSVCRFLAFRYAVYLESCSASSEGELTTATASCYGGIGDGLNNF